MYMENSLVLTCFLPTFSDLASTFLKRNILTKPWFKLSLCQLLIISHVCNNAVLFSFLRILMRYTTLSVHLKIKPVLSVFLLFSISVVNHFYSDRKLTLGCSQLKWLDNHFSWVDDDWNLWSTKSTPTEIIFERPQSCGISRGLHICSHSWYIHISDVVTLCKCWHEWKTLQACLICRPLSCPSEFSHQTLLLV